MSEILQGELMAVGLLTPFVLLLAGWARNISSKLDKLIVEVAANSARQDSTLLDHERRITDLELANR
tara:strand:- start:567 stop:767 length:201 start_codon:yes stop_codon:yes gene_type:complete